MLAPFLLAPQTCGSHTTVFMLVFGEELLYSLYSIVHSVCEHLSLYPAKWLTNHLSWEALQSRYRSLEGELWGPALSELPHGAARARGLTQWPKELSFSGAPANFASLVYLEYWAKVTHSLLNSKHGQVSILPMLHSDLFSTRVPFVTLWPANPQAMWPQMWPFGHVTLPVLCIALDSVPFAALPGPGRAFGICIPPR